MKTEASSKFRASETNELEEENFSDIDGEFDPGSGRTLAACLTHASRTEVTLKLSDK